MMVEPFLNVYVLTKIKKLLIANSLCVALHAVVGASNVAYGVLMKIPMINS
jgi:hypothetical protein